MPRWVLMCVRTQSHRLRLTLVPLPTLDTLNVLRQRLDEHFREAENARSIDLDMAASVALLSGDTGDGFELTQEG